MKAGGLFLLLLAAPSWAIYAPSRVAFVPSGGMLKKNPPPGTTSTAIKKSRFDRLAEKIFDDADENQDGSIDFSEVYELVLKMYVNLNRQAPVPAPSKKRVLQIYLKSDVTNDRKLNKAEFTQFAGIVARRALWRVTAVKICRIVGAPLLTEFLIRKLAGKEWLQNLAKFVVPARFHEKILPHLMSTSLWRPVLLIAFVISLGNIVLSIVNFFLDWSLPDEEKES